MSSTWKKWPKAFFALWRPICSLAGVIVLASCGIAKHYNATDYSVNGEVYDQAKIKSIIKRLENKNEDALFEFSSSNIYKNFNESRLEEICDFAFARRHYAAWFKCEKAYDEFAIFFDKFLKPAKSGFIIEGDVSHFTRHDFVKARSHGFERRAVVGLELGKFDNIEEVARSVDCE